MNGEHTNPPVKVGDRIRITHLMSDAGETRLRVGDVVVVSEVDQWGDPLFDLDGQTYYLDSSDPGDRWELAGDEPPTPAAPPPGTVRVRVAVAVDAEGRWSAGGGTGTTDAAMVNECFWSVGRPTALYYLTADLPIPRPAEVAAGVEQADTNTTHEGDPR